MRNNTHRPQLHHWAVAVGILVITLLTRVADASQATDLSDDQREASIQSFLEYCVGPSDFQQSILVTFTEERIPWDQRSEIQAELSKLNNRPDHPKRDVLQFQLSMFDQPKRELSYCMSPGGDWMFKTYGVRYAQSGNLRWILSKPEGGQLSILKEGVPYPSGFEVGRLKPILLSHHRRLFYAGFSERISKFDINRLNVSAAKWSAEISLSDGNHSEIATIEGKWIGASPVVSSVRSESGESPLLFEQINFDSYDSNTNLSPFTFATSSRSDDNSTRSSVVFLVTKVELLSDNEINALVSVPDLKSALAVRDFREPRSASHDLYADAALTTWSKTNGTDAYDTARLESANVHTEESVETARRNFKLIAIAIFITVLISAIGIRIKNR